MLTLDHAVRIPVRDRFESLTDFYLRTAVFYEAAGYPERAAYWFKLALQAERALRKAAETRW
jgi:hypothetical protein